MQALVALVSHNPRALVRCRLRNGRRILNFLAAQGCFPGETRWHQPPRSLDGGNNQRGARVLLREEMATVSHHL